MRKSILGAFLVLSLLVVAPSTHAAGLTSTQVNAIITLLNAFGADSKTISNVQAALTGQGSTTGTAAGGQQGQGVPPPCCKSTDGFPDQWHGNNNSSTTPPWPGFASTTRPGDQEHHASSTPWTPPTPQNGQGNGACLSLTRNLGIGSQGSDVLELQKWLSADPTAGFTASSTGFFGKLTAEALKRFQINNGISSTSATGIVGTLTRTFFDQHCGSGQGNNQGNGQGNSTGSGTHPQETNVFGPITANSGASITVSYATGSTSVSVIVNLASSTVIQVFNSTTTPPVAGSVASLTVGSKVIVEGTLNADKSVAARTIRVGILPPPFGSH